ncbi:MAG: GNAT family N-acetyltransferase [Janthinobacterium lividum]
MLPKGFSTTRLTLRSVMLEDAVTIFQTYAQDPEVTRFLTWSPHQAVTETAAYIAHCLATPADIGRTYVLIGRDDGKLQGALDLRRSTPHRLEFGYVLGRPFWGSGLMTEALQEVVAWSLHQPAIFRIGASCDVDNIASARVMEKAGLEREGLLRRWLIHPNVSLEPRDCFAYACSR